MASHYVAFGCTEEHLLCMIFGCKARGTSHEGPFDHTTGAGWVQASKGHYHDALYVKKLRVVMLLVEATGGLSPPASGRIWRLARRAAVKGARDGT